MRSPQALGCTAFARLALCAIPCALVACGEPAASPVGMDMPDADLADTEVGSDTAGPDEGLPDARDVDGAAPDQGADAPDVRPPDPIRDDEVPCDVPGHWPHELPSASRPFIVHYESTDDEEVAVEVVRLLEISWQVEVDVLGFRPPLPDGGQCGRDERFDVFLWRDHVESAVDVLAPHPQTDWDDWISYMVLDPWGPYGGDQLGATIAHELNHACQAADDWWESPVVFEMTSTFVEDLVFDDDDEYMALLVDFQSRPDWSIDRDDGYETWFMYAASLYLFFVRDRYFAGDASFLSDMWLRSRNPPGAQRDPLKNEPDFQDALEEILTERAGVGYVDSVVEFAVWRWYTGERDDGQHFEEGAMFPPDAAVRQQTVGCEASSVAIEPMMLGSAYIEVVASDTPCTLRISLGSLGESARWVLQAIHGDGQPLDTDGSVVTIPAHGSKTFVVTAAPDGPYDPDARTDERFQATLLLSPQ